MLVEAVYLLLLPGETSQMDYRGGLALLLCALAAFIALEARQVLGSTRKSVH